MWKQFHGISYLTWPGIPFPAPGYPVIFLLLTRNHVRHPTRRSSHLIAVNISLLQHLANAYSLLQKEERNIVSQAANNDKYFAGDTRCSIIYSDLTKYRQTRDTIRWQSRVKIDEVNFSKDRFYNIPINGRKKWIDTFLTLDSCLSHSCVNKSLTGLNENNYSAPKSSQATKNWTGSLSFLDTSDPSNNY